MSAPAEKILPVPSQTLSPEEAARFLLPFGVGAPERTETLLSYDWEGGAFRRIVRCRYGAGDLVLKVRREEELPLSRLASQCAFSEYLAKNGVRTARLLPALVGENRRLAEAIAARGRELLSALSPFRALPRCAVQGDLADCNLFLTPEGELGMFDFNNCGDNAPYLDAVMHGVYIARLMEYGRPADEALSCGMYARFWRGYTAVRPLPKEEAAAREAFVRLICTFWKFDLLFREDSLAALVKADDGEAVACRLARMAQKLDGRGVFA